MENFYIITNVEKDKDLTVTAQIKEYLEDRGKHCILRSMSDKERERRYRYTDPLYVPDNTDCVLVLGGDGTMLQAARDLVDLKLPLLGVNLGTLGYLAELDGQTLFSGLEQLCRGEGTVTEHMMLKGSIVRKGVVLSENIALNDIVIARGNSLNVIRFKVYVNGLCLNSYAADGMIVATPTGSTAYNLSAGGPIVEPDASMILLTPVSPHTMINRSIVLSDAADIRIELLDLDKNRIAGTLCGFDGEETVELKPGDCIHITRAKQKARILKLNKISFLDVLRHKMSVE